ncbi:hypothetical protein [Thalassomonas sp. M1454]|uniref:hypothetical protein n=1 Tax=Thalassomonas sp. M1454 TaxID=2594477 RepID=UPI00117D2F02|nr:hypothetical protein [Thalassomonas sp. M1454]TRX54443.1 hypothetical protein FNN08_11965 [Thalassomonas sp. M1454]
MKTIMLAIACMFCSVGCTSTDVYPITGSYAKINEMQILDPMAPENNAGIVNDLDGVYGEKVVDGYQKSAVTPKDGKVSSAASQAMDSGSSK